MTDSAVAPHLPGGLLAALVPAGVLRQPEVALTTGIWWVLGMDGAVGALDPLIARNGLAPEPGGRWRTEVVGDGGRSDLEYAWGNPPRTHVLIEAKIGHTLTPEQVVGYADRLPTGGGLLVVLAPAARRAEALGIVARCRDMTTRTVSLDVWTYDDVLAALEAALPASGDVAQLRGLVRAHNATDVEPFDDEDLLEPHDARRDDVWWVVDHASFGVHGTRMPSGSDWSLHRRRYLPVGQYDVALAVGVGRKGPLEGESRPWAWLRLTGGDGYGRIARRALVRIRPDAQDVADETWLPLDVETGVHGSVAAERLRVRLESFVDELAAAMTTEVERELHDARDLDRSLAHTVLGIAPMSERDLLAASDARHADLWTLLTEASRPLYRERLYPRVAQDPDYVHVRYIPVPASDAFVATCLLPREHDVATPAAWLRIHRSTRHAEIGRQVLARLAPGRVTEDPHGWAAPVRIPVGADGPAMLAAVHQQISELVDAYAEAIVAAAAQPSDG